jgi:hypothetical protein
MRGFSVSLIYFKLLKIVQTDLRVDESRPLASTLHLINFELVQILRVVLSLSKLSCKFSLANSHQLSFLFDQRSKDNYSIPVAVGLAIEELRLVAGPRTCQKYINKQVFG